MSYDKCFRCDNFEVIESMDFDRYGQPDGVSPEPHCKILPFKCEYTPKRSITCGNRVKVCEEHGFPCRSCTSYRPIRRVWTKESIMNHFGITEEEYYYRDNPQPVI